MKKHLLYHYILQPLDEEKELLLDELTLLLTSTGLKQDGEVNHEELIIEDVIDLILERKCSEQDSNLHGVAPRGF
jgi:hypothetical protein